MVLFVQLIKWLHNIQIKFSGLIKKFNFMCLNELLDSSCFKKLFLQVIMKRGQRNNQKIGIDRYDCSRL